MEKKIIFRRNLDLIYVYIRIYRCILFTLDRRELHGRVRERRTAGEGKERVISSRIFMGWLAEINLCSRIGCHVIYSRYARSVTLFSAFVVRKSSPIRNEYRSHSISMHSLFALQALRIPNFLFIFLVEIHYSWLIKTSSYYIS